MSADEFLIWCFDSIIYILKWSVSTLKRIPTGFGVSLWSLFIASFITTVVVVAVVNVVKVGPDSVFNYQAARERSRRQALSKSRSKSSEDTQKKGT